MFYLQLLIGLISPKKCSRVAKRPVPVFKDFKGVIPMKMYCLW